MKEKIISRLLTVKSIVTLSLTIVFAYLAASSKIAPENFQDIFYIIIAFYFGSSLEKTANSNNMKSE